MQGEDNAKWCGYVWPQSGICGLSAMVEQGTIVRIDVDSPRVTTEAGVGVGSTEDDVRRAYGARLKVYPHRYYDEGHYLEVPDPSDPQRYRIIFETDGKRVTTFRAGRVPEVDLVEGCS